MPVGKPTNTCITKSMHYRLTFRFGLIFLYRLNVDLNTLTDKEILQNEAVTIPSAFYGHNNIIFNIETVNGFLRVFSPTLELHTTEAKGKSLNQ